MRLSEDFIRELKYANELVSVVSSYTDLKKAGRLAKCRCPFHNEKTPSFTVYEDNQSFYCFGCGAGGDVISFIMRQENLDYLEAVRFLCERAGLAFPEDEATDAISQLKARILQMNKAVARYYYSQLTGHGGEKAAAYLHGRGVSPAMIKHFGLGFAPESWHGTIDYLKSQGYNETEMIQGFLAAKSAKSGRLYDQFRNRVMFPIFDLRGNVVAFSGRTLSADDPRKYLNSGDTSVFKKSRTLFAMNFAKKSKAENIIVCEGNLDVVAIHQAGFENAVATLGTALSEEHARLLAQYAGEVVLAYDADEAGQKATKRAITILEKTGMKTRVLHITGAKDPDEYIKKFGAVRFGQLIAGSADSTDFQLQQLKTKFDVSQPDQKVDFLRGAIRIIAPLGAIERDVYSSRLADELEVSKEAILAEVKALLKKEFRKREKEQRTDFSIKDAIQGDRVNPERNAHYRAARAEEDLIALVLTHNELLAVIEKDFSPDDMVTAFNRRVMETICTNIREKNFADISIFNEGYTPDEVGRVMRMVAKFSELTRQAVVLDPGFQLNLEEKAVEAVQSLRQERSAQTAQTVAELDDDALKDFLAGLAKDKG